MELTEDDLKFIEGLGGKAAELVRRYRSLSFVARQARRLGFVATEAMVSGRVGERHVECPSGEWMRPGVERLRDPKKL